MSPVVLVWNLHLAAVAFMTGLIWLVQLVHYPLMSDVDRTRFVEFHAAHSDRITWIVGPAMLLEAVTAALLPILLSPSIVVLACIALTGVVFASTAFLSVPQHGRLTRGFDPEAHRRLVSTNWVRTMAWSLHLALCLVQTGPSLCAWE